jgi:hypothetical protein
MNIVAHPDDDLFFINPDIYDVTPVLLSILNSYQPTVLRYQDPTPDSRYYVDHADHYAGADSPYSGWQPID